MNYEEKYNQALERAKEFMTNKGVAPDADAFKTSKELTEIIFPELAESEDVNIKQTLIGHLKECRNNTYSEVMIREYAKWISWLEKQGEKKPADKIQLGKKYKCIASPRYSTFMIGKIYKPEDKFLCSLMNFCSDCFEPIEDGEPKFKVGDWISKQYVSSPFVIVDVDIKNNLYILNDIEGNNYKEDIDFTHDRYHLWNIKDAEDGDVLAFDNDTIVIFKDLYNSSTFHSYCHIEDGLFDISKDGMPDWWEGKGFHPATKEQRAMLFAKMKETGYEWDVEKKELKKIEQKPAWSEEDEGKLKAVCTYIQDYPRLSKITDIKRFNEYTDWLRALKERLQLHPKQEWSKEDEKNIESIESFLRRPASIPLDLYNTLTNWLKSLKPQNHWKPNKEQMIALRWVLNNVPYNKHKEVISQMVEQFKEL